MKNLPRSWVTLGLLSIGVIALDLSRRVYGLPVTLLLFAGVTLIAVVMLMWNSLQALGGESEMTLDEALSLAAPAAEEEQKRAVLRSLKDLDYEKRVGKIRDEDYRSLAARYRTEARALLGQLDARYEPVRKRIEDELAERLEQEGSEPNDETKDISEQSTKSKDPVEKRERRSSNRKLQSRSESVARTDEKSAKEREGTLKISEEGDKNLESSRDIVEPKLAASKQAKPTRACRECGSRNDLDTTLCGNCKTALAAADERLCLACPSRYQESLSACPQCGVPSEDS